MADEIEKVEEDLVGEDFDGSEFFEKIAPKIRELSILLGANGIRMFMHVVISRKRLPDGSDSVRVALIQSPCPIEGPHVLLHMVARGEASVTFRDSNGSLGVATAKGLPQMRTNVTTPLAAEEVEDALLSGELDIDNIASHADSMFAAPVDDVPVDEDTDETEPVTLDTLRRKKAN